MKKIVVALLFVWPLLAWGWEVDSRSGGVSIIRVDLYSGTTYRGADYYAINRNAYGVYAYIYLTKAYLTLDGLKSEYVYVEPGGEAYLGWVWRQQLHTPFYWQYQWQAVPDQ